MENYSLADIRAATDHEDGFDGQGSWFWIVVLFLFMFGFGGNGFGRNGEALTRADLCQDFNFNDLQNGVRGIQNGLCDGFYAQNTTMLNGFNSIGSQIAESRFAQQNCCCETNRNIDAVRSDGYKNTCEITTAIHAEGEATRALINSNTMQSLRDRLTAKDQELQTANFQLSQQAQNATLISALRPFPTPAYITCSPYTASNGFGCNTGCGCA
jgi:hypothetical protein